MPTKTNAKTNAKASGFPLEFLYGGKAIPESLVLRGMKDLERELTRQFQADRRIEIEAAGHIQKTREVWLQPYAQDERLRQAVAGLSGIDARLGKQKLAPPKLKADKQRIFTGSIGATVTPPIQLPMDMEQHQWQPVPQCDCRQKHRKNVLQHPQRRT
jgi:hypothetical protein